MGGEKKKVHENVGRKNNPKRKPLEKKGERPLQLGEPPKGKGGRGTNNNNTNERPKFSS